MKNVLLIAIALLAFNILAAQTTLPVNRTTWNAGAPTGWTDHYTGAYTSSFACSTNNGGKMDASTDYYQVYFNSAPDQLSFSVKVSGSTTSTFLIEESADGSTWTTVANLTSLPTSCTTQNYTLNSSSRYVKWTYTKVSQNLSIDDVSISALSTNSTESIIEKKVSWSEPTNIAYATYSAASGLSTSNAIEVGKFTIKDGGADGTDTDTKTTKLTSISFGILNYSNIAALAIFDGTTKLGEITTVGSTATFSSLNLIAADEATKDFSIYATFKTTVTDNQNLKFTITAATADVTGSCFSTADAGGAATDNTSNNNKIVVSASQLSFTQQPGIGSTTVAMNPAPVVSFVDANNNVDLDITGATYNVSLTTTASFDASATTLVTPSSGQASFSNLIFSATGTAKTLTASEASTSYANVTSHVFNILNVIQPDSDIIYISEVSDASSDYKSEFIELYNNSTSTVDMSKCQLLMMNSVGTVANSWDFTADLASLGSTSLEPDGYLVIARGATQSAFETEWGTLATGVAFNQGNTGMYFGTSTSRRWQITKTLAKATTIIDDTRKTVAGSGKDSKQLSDDSWTTYTNLTASNPGSQSGDGSTLPVEWLSFTANINQDITMLHWVTATENQNDYFEIQYSLDAKNFENIGRVSGNGTSINVSKYQFEVVSNQARYYRLKQVDFDANYQYSPIILAKASSSNMNLEKIYFDAPSLNLWFSNPQSGQINAYIYATDGKLIYDYKLQTNVNQQHYKLFVGNHLKGIYYIKMKIGDQWLSKKVLF